VHGQGWSKRVQLIIFIANCRQNFWKSGKKQSNELTNNSVIVMHVNPTKTTITSPTLLSLISASPPVLSIGLQTVKFIAKKVKMCRFSSGNWFFCTKFVHLAVAGKRHNTVVHLHKRV
jgi:hypothetical protein